MYGNDFTNILHFPNLYYSKIEDTMSYSVTKTTGNFSLLH